MFVAVQEERQRVKEKGEEVDSTNYSNNDMPVEKILEAELSVEQKCGSYVDTGVNIFLVYLNILLCFYV